MAKYQLINVETLKENENNPRFIKDEKFKKLCISITEFPKMLELRPIVADENNIVLGGNMRLKACKHLGIKEAPVIFVKNLTEKEKAEFIIKDNVGFGDWDWGILANKWEEELLADWGLDVPKFSSDDDEGEKFETDSQFFLNIICTNEEECHKLYEEFIEKGLNVKIVT